MKWFNRKKESVALASKPAAASKAPKAEVATGLVPMSFGFVETNEILKSVGLVREDLTKILSDEEISQSLATRQEAVLGASWGLAPGGGKEFDFVWSQLERHIKTIIKGAWEAVPYGYAVQEVIWGMDETGKSEVAKVKNKPFKFFYIKDGELYFKGRNGEAQVNKKPKFLITVRDQTEEHVHGVPLLASVYWPYWFKKEATELWGTALERFGAPILLGKTPSKSTEQLQSFAEVLLEAGRSGALAINDIDSVETLSVSQPGVAPHQSFIEYFNKQIQKVILGQNLTSEVQGGSFAAAKVHNLIRRDKLVADCQLIAGTVQQFVDMIYYYNFPGMIPPNFYFDEGIGLQADRAERDAKLAPVMLTSGKRLTSQYFLDAYGFEEDHFEDIPAGSQPSGSQFGLSLSANSPKDTPIEKFIMGEVATAKSPIDAKTIYKAIKASKSLADLELKLGEILEQTGNVSRFTEIYEQALFASDIIGLLEARNEAG